MITSGNTVLITGGASGIGLALAEAFLHLGNQVLICGRRGDRLQAAQDALPGLHTRLCDVADAAERRQLATWAASTFPNLNILVNNAGIQRAIDFRQGPDALVQVESEIATNFEAPIHLSALFIPHLSAQPHAAIVNVTSGLAFVPSAMFPVYCATKAALHSFSRTLRHQLRNTPIMVFEIVPPLVDTELNAEFRQQRASRYRGITPDVVAAGALAGMERDQLEIAIGDAATRMMAGRSDPDGAFRAMNKA